MAILHVQALSTVRGQLSQLVDRFRREGPSSAPVVFGTHRRPEAVLLPYAAYEDLMETRAWRERLDNAMSAAQSVLVESPGPFSVEHQQLVNAYVSEEMSADDAYARALARHRRP